MPIAVFATSANLLVVHPSVPAKTVKEFIAVIKKIPGKMNFSSSGSGSTQHLSGEMLKLMIKGDFTHIPYKGTGPSLTALIPEVPTMAEGACRVSSPRPGMACWRRAAQRGR